MIAGTPLSSGVVSRPRRRRPTPIDIWPLAHDSGIDRMRPAMVGDIHTTSEGDSTPAASSVTKPSAVCERWRRTMAAKGIEPSSRRCGFQPVSRPERICSTAPDWITIMIEASAAETRISIRVDRNRRTAPPQPRRVSRIDAGGDHAEDLGREQHRDRHFEQLQRAFVVEARPGREQREFGGEIFRPDEPRLQHQHDADQQLRHPQRRGEIAHDAVDRGAGATGTRGRWSASTRACCRLPWHQRRSRAARSISDGGLSS